MKNVPMNGWKFAYERYGNGLPLVLLHGYPLDHTIWEPLIPLLEKDFDLILPDLRGFGASGMPASGNGMADFAADITSLLDSLGIWKAFIAGHSMGGYIALSFARVHPQRLLGMGLVSSQVLADTPERKVGRQQEADDILANGVSKVAESFSVKLTPNPDLQARLKELTLQQRPQGLAAALRAMAERPDSSTLLIGAAFPIVAIHGIADALIPIERARSLKAALPAASLIELPAVGHMPMMEAPQMTAEALRTLNRL